MKDVAWSDIDVLLLGPPTLTQRFTSIVAGCSSNSSQQSAAGFTRTAATANGPAFWVTVSFVEVDALLLDARLASAALLHFSMAVVVHQLGDTSWASTTELLRRFATPRHDAVPAPAARAVQPARLAARTAASKSGTGASVRPAALDAIATLGGATIEDDSAGDSAPRVGAMLLVVMQPEGEVGSADGNAQPTTASLDGHLPELAPLVRDYHVVPLMLAGSQQDSCRQVYSWVMASFQDEQAQKGHPPSWSEESAREVVLALSEGAESSHAGSRCSIS